MIAKEREKNLAKENIQQKAEKIREKKWQMEQNVEEILENM